MPPRTSAEVRKCDITEPGRGRGDRPAWDFSTLQETTSALAQSGYTTPAPSTSSRALGSHLTLQLALLLEAEVFRSVGHHGEGLLGVVSVGQRVDQASLRAKTRD